MHINRIRNKYKNFFTTLTRLRGIIAKLKGKRKRGDDETAQLSRGIPFVDSRMEKRHNLSEISKGLEVGVWGPEAPSMIPKSKVSASLSFLLQPINT